MKTGGVSSLAVSQAMRYSLQRSQTELVNAQKEMSTLKKADLGLALGAGTARAVNFERDLDRLNGIVDSNSLVSTRLSSTQKSLDRVSALAKDFLSTLTAGVSGDSSNAIVQTVGKTTLESLTSVLNLSVNGEHLFSGTNTDVTPIADFSDAGSPAKAAFDAAFQSHFGFTQDDPAAAGITAADMDSFITSAIEPQFMGSGWANNWSSATDQPITSRIALNETSDTSVSANATGIRKLAMAAASITALMSSNLSVAGKKQLVERAALIVGDAVAGVAELQSRTGILEKQVTDASTRIKMQTDLFEKHLLELEGVDPTETAARVSDLVAHVDTSLALTARIQQLSLLKFLT